MQIFYYGDGYPELPLRSRWLEWLVSCNSSLPNIPLSTLIPMFYFGADGRGGWRLDIALLWVSATRQATSPGPEKVPSEQEGLGTAFRIYAVDDAQQC
jgi:hypothetical protein